MNELRVPPNNIEAEVAVLGSILVRPEILPHVQETIAPDDFYREAHQHIFRAMWDLSEKAEPIDLKTLSFQLSKNELLEKSGGDDYLSSIADSVSTSAAWKHYADQLRDFSDRRLLMMKCTETIEACYELRSVEIDDLHADLDDFISAQNNRKISNDFSGMDKVISDSFKQAEKAYKNHGKLTGLATGFTDFDNLTAGLQPSDLIIIAARPAIGKTALALNIANNIDDVVGIFSLEMSKVQLGLRLLSMDSSVDTNRVRFGNIRDTDWQKLTDTANRLYNKQIYIDDTSSLTLQQIKYKCRKLKKAKGLSLIIIDYLQMMEIRADSREQEIAKISRGLKGIAKEFNVPLICLSQLNRKVEDRPNKRPRLADIRESGAVEQDADVIVFIYRDEVYNPTTEENHNIAEVIVAKQRNGPTGYFKLTFLSEYTRFENYASGY